MRDYDPSLQRIPAREIVVAWAVAMAAVAMLLVLPDLAEWTLADGVEVGTKTAIEQTLPRDTDLYANGQLSP